MEITILNRLFGKRITVPFIDSFNDPVVILARDGRVLEVNSVFSTLAGIGKEDITGKDCRAIEPLNSLWNSITACIFHRAQQSERITFGGLSLDVSIAPIITSGSLNHVCIVLRDITSFESLERKLVKRNMELMITNTLSGAFISSGDMNSVFNDLLDKVLLISDLGMGWIVLRQEDGYELKSLKGISLEFRNKLESGKLDFIYDAALKSGEPLYILESPDALAIEDLKKEGIVFFSSIPLRAGSEVMGFLMLASRVEIEFDFDLASLLSLIGNNLSLIADKIRLFQEARRLAITDSLTGLYNVRHFYTVLESEIARSKRYDTLFSLVIFDIDNFKSLNDTYGHQAGDEVLRSVAGIMKSTSRGTDIIARYGGEEFVSILPNTSRDEAFRLASRAKEAVEQSRFLGPEAVGITLSGGVATFPEDAEDAKSLLYAADMAMYEAKEAGKKRIFSHKKK